MFVKMYYKLLEMLCEKIVVLDPILGDKLSTFVNDSKVVRLNMPVEKRNKWIKESREKH